MLLAAMLGSDIIALCFAAELVSELDATNQGSLIQLCFQEIICGAQSPASLVDAKRHLPMDVGGDAKAVFDSVTYTPIRTPDDKVLLLHARAMREYVETGHVDRLYWFDTEDMLPDGMTNMFH